MSEIKVNSIKGVGASAAAITVNNTDGTCTANITNNLSNRNLIINGAMQVAQRGTSSTSTGIQTCDRWHLAYGGTDEAPTQAQVDLSSSDTPYSSGFRKSYKITNGNQTSGAGASDFISFLTPLEAQELANSGWNYTDPNSKLTIQFWAKSSVAKTFCVQLYTVDGTSQAYNHHYALAANTWTKITHTFPGYANVQFDNDANKGIEIQWNMFAGTTYTSGSTVDQWVTYSGTTSTPDDTSDWYTTNDATFEITGVQLEVGSVATDFEHLSFANELTRCERYYQLIAPSVAEALISDTVDYDNTTYFTCDLHTPMRIAPSLVVGNHTDAFRLYGTNARNVNTLLANTGVTTTSKILLYATGGSSGAGGFARIFKNTSGNQSGGTYATIAVNAEL